MLAALAALVAEGAAGRTAPVATAAHLRAKAASKRVKDTDSAFGSTGENAEAPLTKKEKVMQAMEARKKSDAAEEAAENEEAIDEKADKFAQKTLKEVHEQNKKGGSGALDELKENSLEVAENYRDTSHLVFERMEAIRETGSKLAILNITVQGQTEKILNWIDELERKLTLNRTKIGKEEMEKHRDVAVAIHPKDPPVSRKHEEISDELEQKIAEMDDVLARRVDGKDTGSV